MLVAYPGSDPSGAVVDDVVREAKISRATFYKHFTSLEEAVQELTAQLSQEFALMRASIYSDLTDPKFRAATGFQLFLSRAVIDPDWATFITHGHRLSRSNALTSDMRKDLEAGFVSGDFSIPDLDIAVDLIIGTKVEAMHQLRRVTAPRAYIETMTSMFLRSLSIPPADADATATMVAERLKKEGPELLSWWRPFD
ncbi:TetR/AcrR family transcriptional regulator [Sphingobium sp. SCG-1]|uniref:TetR/AcrR family transcriptional regulator n=1 Tax=Sphingobium sp. SCG-1 TaxID=2072936 RepID=UPI00166FF674|nr:TetR/AcrR family transcriptional regulator [Sphingobium sp. SCG-1]